MNENSATRYAIHQVSEIPPPSPAVVFIRMLFIRYDDGN